MRLAIGTRGLIVSETELTRLPDGVCRSCGRPFVAIIASTARRKGCPECHTTLIEAVGEIK